MSKRKEITSYFQPKKKQTTTCEDEEPSAASIEVTGDGVEPLIFGGINSNSEQHPQNPEIVNEGRCGSNTFTVKGFNSWRKVNNGKDCAFRCHVGKGDGSNSAHNFAAKCYYNLKNQPCHLEKIVEKQRIELTSQRKERKCNMHSRGNGNELKKAPHMGILLDGEDTTHRSGPFKIV
ncbi:hypothetical protein POM88_029554 [Heracleum sosnowskyi]|uniref:Uncharacterized protein n=1 Tax=Heracleum sosnowskyi TaxID=360622 RepID=A0AAD8HV34_9APIA|nr:hypothetical protein POM88_029554 [Heracleum sosnowskyi]